VLLPRGALLSLLMLACLVIRAGAEESSALLDTAAAVRALAPEAAAQHRPVRLRGNLLLVTAPRNAFVLLDRTEGIYVELPEVVEASLQLGDELEVTGVTEAGDFAPIVVARSVERRGRGNAQCRWIRCGLGRIARHRPGLPADSTRAHAGLA